MDIRLSAGISVATFYRCLHLGMHAILKCTSLSLHFPTSTIAQNALASNFACMSNRGSISGCVAAIDGWLCPIVTPRQSETASARLFFSGHYQTYGLNVQAACNSSCEFVEVCVTAPGGSNDIAAYRRTAMKGFVDNLPIGCYVVGDAAYICSEHLLTPFAGTQTVDKWKDSYNFHLSQCRITIECAFGILVAKWRIFKAPLTCRLQTRSEAIMCATRLHNFILRHEKPALFVADAFDTADTDDNGPIEDHQNNSKEDCDKNNFTDKDVDCTNVYLRSDQLVIDIPGNSVICTFLVDDLKRKGTLQPTYNIKRNKNNNSTT